MCKTRFALSFFRGLPCWLSLMQAGGRGGGRQQGGARTGGRGTAPGAAIRLASPQNGGVSKPGRSSFKQVPLSLLLQQDERSCALARDLETVTCPWQSVS